MTSYKTYFLIIILVLGFTLLGQAQDIQILTPRDGVVVSPGASIDFSFSLSTNVADGYIFFPGGVVRIVSGMTRYSIPTSSFELGNIEIGLIGITKSGQWQIEKRIAAVETAERPTALIIPIKEITLSGHYNQMPILVLGDYSDGMQREITYYGTTFESSNTAVATVASDGMVTSTGTGECLITVRNGDLFDTVSITVVPSAELSARIWIATPAVCRSTQDAFLICYIELPDGSPAIDPATVLLNYMLPCADSQATVADSDGNGIPELCIRFALGEVFRLFPFDGKQQIPVAGQTQNGYFQGYLSLEFSSKKPALPFKEFSIKHWQIHWSKEKTKFIISGKLTLPDDYKKNDLEKKANINIGLNKKDGSMFTQETPIDFYKYGHSWFYQNTQNHQSNTGSLIIDKMRIFWQPQFRTSKYAFSNKTAEFFIEGSLIMSKQDKVNLSPNAQLTLNIPIQNITTVGALEGSDTFILDITPPTGTIKINNNASYASLASVALNLSAADETSGMGNGAQMRFSNDNITWTKSEIYVKAKTWTLSSGDGNKIVYAKFKDAAGNWSEPVSASIILDTTAPAITQTSTTSNSGITFIVKVTDAGSEVREVFLYWRKWIWKWGWRWSEWRKERLILRPDKLYSGILTANQVEHRKIEYYIYAKDKIGNEARTLKYQVKR